VAVFGRRKREEAAAADAAREAERRALFTKLAERPEAICPFLGLADDRTGYVDGISDDHRCFAFGDPSPISAEQQTRVCQEPGYGNCPRYLRGVLVIPTEELEALRKPRAPIEAAAAPPPPAPEERRRRGAPVLLLLALVVLVGGGAGAFLLLGGDDGIAQPTPTPTLSAAPTIAPPTATAEPPTAEPAPSVEPTGLATPTPEPTPEVGDEFAFYEVSVGPDEFTLYTVDGESSRVVSFDGYSFARAEPEEGGDAEVYWVTQDGDLAGWAYRYPASGEFRIRAVYLNSAGERRSVYLEQNELDEIPEATPAP
jgi:hypothetical protein